MHRFLLCISLLTLLHMLPLQAQHYVLGLDSTRSDLRISINMRGTQLTGILIIVHDDTGELRGTMVNEFGVRLFDFSAPNRLRRTRLHHMMGAMNKRYVRHIVASDLTHLLRATNESCGHIVRHHTTSTDSSGLITLTNLRHNITYTLRPITQP